MHPIIQMSLNKHFTAPRAASQLVT